MSRSYKKHVFSSWGRSSSMKEWRTQENRRLRHNAKQLINNCLDFDGLIIPVLNDYDTLWGSPKDGRNYYMEIPLLNECEIDSYEYRTQQGPSRADWHDKFYKFDGEHYANCRCYGSANSFYERTRRKQLLTCCLQCANIELQEIDMCIVSNISEHYRDDWTKPRTWDIGTYTVSTVPFSEVTKEEFEALKAEVEEMKELLRMAKILDEKTGQPDCEMDDKVALIKKIAEAVGVDLADIFEK